MFLYSLARKANAKRKIYLKQQAGKTLSPVRRIEFVAPPTKGKFCAMTFDDGPCVLPPSPGDGTLGLTTVLLNTLSAYGAKGTFDVVGNTGENYPDEEGKAGDFTWSGVHYDHYPRFNMDAMAGAVNQPTLIRRILDEGHEVTNHSYVHRLFGPMRAVYGARHHFQTLEQVTEDLNRLHRYMEEQFGYTMRLSRPPHYIDKIPSGGSAYDAYRQMNYQYMAASFDGGGWLPSPSYSEEVEAMIAPMRRALEADPNCLNGTIIFQKDGCSMNLTTPIADALEAHLKLLRDAGYQVVTVSQLLAMSPFEDVNDAQPEWDAVRRLLALDHTVGYRNNSFQGDRAVTLDELRIMASPATLFRKERGPITYGDMCQLAKSHWETENLLTGTRPIGNLLLDAAMKTGATVAEAPLRDAKTLPRRVAVQALAPFCEATERS